VAEFNRDGKLDLVTANWVGGLPGRAKPTFVAPGYCNRDGKIGAAVGDTLDAETVMVLLGNVPRAGGLRRWQRSAVGGIGDFDGDSGHGVR
jgi:hypothetical protein